MKKLSLFCGGVAAVYLLTAGTPRCPNCLVLSCSADTSELTLSGPGVGLESLAAEVSFESSDGSSYCELEVSPGTITPLPGGQFELSLSHSGNCGSPTAVVLALDDGNGGFSPYGACL